MRKMCYHKSEGHRCGRTECFLVSSVLPYFYKKDDFIYENEEEKA